MIEIKQENTGYISLHGTFIHGSIHHSDIPHLISRLIELGGGSKWPDIPGHIPNDEAAAWIVQNYHLIPKADKK